MTNLSEISTMTNACAGFLLNEITPEQADFINKNADLSYSIEQYNRIFYDTFCLPQSGLYCPPFRHVMQGVTTVDGQRSYPKAKFDGGAEIEGVYNQFGFDLSHLEYSKIMKGRFIPGDHLGIMLTFLALSINDENFNDPQSKQNILTFIDRYIKDDWINEYSRLLNTRQDTYLDIIAESILATKEDLVSLL